MCNTQLLKPSMQYFVTRSMQYISIAIYSFIPETRENMFCKCTSFSEIQAACCTLTRVRRGPRTSRAPGSVSKNPLKPLRPFAPCPRRLARLSLGFSTADSAARAHVGTPRQLYARLFSPPRASFPDPSRLKLCCSSRAPCVQQAENKQTAQERNIYL